MARPEPGSLVAQYRLERRLGAGGMGEVFLARDTALKRQVAIKFLNKADEPNARHRVMREARAIAAIEHPAICGIYEVGNDAAAGDFIVMQYMPGETLAARLGRGRMARADALRLGARLAEALQVAHEAGVVHRDLKPQNVVLDKDDAPRLLDFGIARRLPDAAGLGDATTETGSFDSVLLAGTPAYMAPEQIEGRTADARTDLFALGCVLYECLTARRAFTGATSRDVLDAVLTFEPPPPSTIASDLTAADDALCAKLLAKDPAQRFQTAAEVRSAIAAAQAGQNPDDGWRSWFAAFTRRRSVLASLAAVLAITVAAWLWLGRGAAAPPIPPAAVDYYEQGVEKLRQGSYATAGGLFAEAIKVHEPYILAHARLAETLVELDDLDGANLELNRVHTLIEDGSRLSRDDRRRFEAVQASARREHESAIAAYLKIMQKAPNDSRWWLDLGRAYEAAAEVVKAREAYAKAVELDSQSAAARLRLGAMQALELDSLTAAKSFEEAERLFRIRADPEGQAEVGYRQALLLTAGNRFDEAAKVIEEVIEQTKQYGFTSLQIRAEFQRAAIVYRQGNASRSEALAQEAVDRASDLRLRTLVAEGLITAAVPARDTNPALAKSRIERAIKLAEERQSRRTAWRAKAQLADLLIVQHRPAEAVKLAQEAREFFTSQRFVRNAAEATLILAQAHDSLGELDTATALAAELASIAEARQDKKLALDAQTELVTVNQKRGLYPTVLAAREKLDPLFVDPIGRAYNATHRAEALIILGRSRDARDLLARIQSAIDNKEPGYDDRQPRVVMLRALLFTSLGQHENVLSLEAPASMNTKPDTALQFRALVEHARAQLGRRGASDGEVSAWPAKTSDVSLGYELAFCAASTLAARRSWTTAYEVSTAALARLQSTNSNLEVRWRLAAIAAVAAQHWRPSAARNLARSASDDLNRLVNEWGDAARHYRARVDLSAWQKAVESDGQR